MSDTSDAQALYESFQRDPVGTYAQVGQLFEEAGYLTRSDPEAALTADEVSEWRLQRELAAYDAEIERITSDPANADIDPNLIHTFVAAAEGDFDDAINRYRAFSAQFLAKYGVTPSAAAAPPIAGGTSAADYRGQEGLHRAIEDVVAGRAR